MSEAVLILKEEGKRHCSLPQRNGNYLVVDVDSVFLQNIKKTELWGFVSDCNDTVM